VEEEVYSVRLQVELVELVEVDREEVELVQ
jgi:hypothetical protein